MEQSLYDIEIRKIDGGVTTLGEFRGKTLLVVNTASKCGLTPQYEGLQKLYTIYRDRGLEILGFPCNQFAGQEPGTEAEIQAFCSLNYATTFPMFAKVEVNGKNTHPLFDILKNKAPGLMGLKDIKWNFTKFLVDKNGNVVRRYAPTTVPEDIAKDIESIL